MKDKFEIFQTLMLREAESNHYGCYISTGQIGEIMSKVNEVYISWDDNLSLDANVNKVFYTELGRTIGPLNDAVGNELRFGFLKHLR